MSQAESPDKVSNITLICAMDRNKGIGNNGMMPWHIPEDLAYFRNVTLNHIVIMGRITWCSLPKPLDRRQNVVITRDTGFEHPHALVVHSIEECLRLISGKPAYVIGGADVFRQFITIADRMLLTIIENEFVVDTWFPDFSQQDWAHVSKRVQRSISGYDIGFNEFVRIRITD